jgi:hypothetical protein
MSPRFTWCYLNPKAHHYGLRPFRSRNPRAHFSGAVSALAARA